MSFRRSLFYPIAKFLWFAAQPGNSVLLILALGLGLTATRWIAAGQVLIALVVAAGAALVLLPVKDWVAAPLEDRFPRPVCAPAHIDGILVLGGGELQRVTHARDDVEMSQHLMRLVEAAALLRQHPEATLYFAGGGIDFTPGLPTEAAIARGILTLIGADLARVRFEDRSRDTWENFVNTKALARPVPGQVWVLVTSALHMPRSMGIATRLGWPMLAWPTDYISIPDARRPEVRNLARSLYETQEAFREWVGLAAYRLAGKTETLFPAPQGDTAAVCS